MLDLVVEAAHEGRHPETDDVAARENLPAQEVDLGVGGYVWHSLVIWREGRAHVDAEDGELHSKKRERHPNGKEREYDAEI